MASYERELAERDEKIASLEKRNASIRRSASESAAEAMDTGASILTGFALGKAEANGVDIGFMGLDTPTVVGGVAYVAGEVVDGEAGRLLRAVGRGALSVASYNFGRRP
jgi:hypothetical protein